MRYPQLVKPRSNRSYLSGGFPQLDRSNPLASGLISYYLPGLTYGFDLASTNRGTLQNSPAVTLTAFGPALKLNGANYVEVPTSASLNPSSITVSAWVVASSWTSAVSGIIVKNDGLGYYALLVRSSGKLAVYLIGGGADVHYDATGTYTLATRLVYYLAFTYDTAQLNGYVNGSPDGNAAGAGPITSDIGNLIFGADPVNAGRFFDGSILRVILHNRALTQAEILSLYFAPDQLLIFPEDVIAAQFAKLSVTIFSDTRSVADFSLTARSANERKRTVWWS